MEPFGDNSRYWIGPVNPSHGKPDITAIEDAFKRSESFTVSLLLDVLTLRPLRRRLRRSGKLRIRRPAHLRSFHLRATRYGGQVELRRVRMGHSTCPWPAMSEPAAGCRRVEWRADEPVRSKGCTIRFQDIAARSDEPDLRFTSLGCG